MTEQGYVYPSSAHRLRIYRAIGLLVVAALPFGILFLNPEKAFEYLSSCAGNILLFVAIAGYQIARVYTPEHKDPKVFAVWNTDVSSERIFVSLGVVFAAMGFFAGGGGILSLFGEGFGLFLILFRSH